MNQSIITWVAPTTLQANTLAASLYSVPENYETIKENIKQMGILEPLIVSDNIVVSGNLRLQIALELGFELIPVMVNDEVNAHDELTITSHSQQRIKTYQEILQEYEILEKSYKLGQGCRTDKNVVKQKHKKILEEFNVNTTMINTLKKVKSLSEELYGEKSEESKALWEKVNSGEMKPNAAKKILQKALSEKINAEKIPSFYEISDVNFNVYNKSCKNMDEIESESVACIYTSPPYYGMRDYGTGSTQRGQEDKISDYIKGLISDFSDCWRVLKADGSFWVNINEPVVEGSYHAISFQFVLAMLQEGWILNDEWIWFKTNAQFTQAKRAVRTHEYIFQFVKSNEFYYDKSWLDYLNDPDNRISRGTSGKVANLISGIDFRGTVHTSSGNNLSVLKNKCKVKGFNLTHSAGFPISLPTISILATSKEGDLVLDTCNGTGTTGEAALKLGRRYAGYEIKPEFILASEVRMSEFISDSNKCEIAA